MNEENNNVNIEDNQVEGTSQEVTYTESQLQEMLQRETDRRVSSAIAKAQAKWESKMQEAEKLREMDVNQRKQYEFDLKLKEFEEEKRAFALDRNKLEATKVLANRGLPINFVDYVIAEDAETMMNKIQEFEREFKSAVNDAVTKKIGNSTPKMGNATQSGMTKEEFSKLSISQQSEIYRTNPNLYKQLMN